MHPFLPGHGPAGCVGQSAPGPACQAGEVAPGRGAWGCTVRVSGGGGVPMEMLIGEAST